jgi:hypothetical protein
MPGMPPSWKIILVNYIPNPNYPPDKMPGMPPSWKIILVNYIPNQE